VSVHVVDDGAAEFEVDAHGVQSDQADDPEAQPTPEEAVGAVAVAMGWTPEEASQLICAIWNMGILLYGPEWAAHPNETAGWDISAAQLLDEFLPKGTGGFVQLGAGLMMVGNGLAMMAVRRVPIIRRGPRPLWQRKNEQPAPPPPTDAEHQRYEPDPPAPAASNGDGAGYHFPRGLAPRSTDGFHPA
jgi:hypothetical protein